MIPCLLEKPAERWIVTAPEYHADHSVISHSMMERYDDSIEAYAAQFVNHTLPPEPPTAAMRVGTALHAYVLQNDEYDDLVAIEPEVNKRTNAGKEELAEFMARWSHKTIITGEQHQTIMAMRDSIMRNPVARRLIEAPGDCEYAIRWADPITGMPCKAMFDKWIAGAIINVKKVAQHSQRRFQQQMVNFGYHRQLAHYLAGLKVYDETAYFDAEHLWLIVSEKPPHECWVGKLDQDSITVGFEQNREILNRMAESYARGKWVPASHEGIIELSLPRWAKPKTENFYEDGEE